MSNNNDDNNRNPGLAQVLQEAIENKLCDVHTGMPGAIVSYDRSTQLAKIQPHLKRKYKDGREVELPIIHNVPVQFLFAGEFYIHFDPKPGDTGFILFSERSIDKWLDLGSPVVPGDKRKHDLSDAFFLPGFRAKPKAIKDLKGSEDSLVLVNNGNYIEIKKDGKMVLKNSTAEVIDLMVQFLDNIIIEQENHIAGLNLTAIGPFPKEPGYISTLEQRKLKYEEIKADLETFKE